MGPATKERIIKEDFRRIKKIWSTEFSGYHKFTQHDEFAVPTIIPKFGMFEWVINELNKNRQKNTKNGNNGRKNPH